MLADYPNCLATSGFGGVWRNRAHLINVNIFLDGHPLRAPRPTLSGAFEAAVEATRSGGRVIIEVKGDGLPLADDLVAAPPDVAAGITELRFTSADPRQLVRVTLLDAADALSTAQADQLSAADLINSGQTGAALEHLRGALTTWQAVQDVLERSSQLLGLDLSSLDGKLGSGVAGGPASGLDPEMGFGRALETLTTHLASVRTGLTAQDWSALSDTVGYDLDAQIDVWKRLLAALAEHVSTLPVGTGSGA